MSQTLGILLVGHGTKSSLGTQEFGQVAKRLEAAFSEYPLTSGFLEQATPTIDSAMQKLAAKRVTSVLIAPLLLFSAGHAKMDIPAAVANSAAKWDISVAGQAEVLGSHPRLVELSLRRYLENGGTETPAPALVVVGRGSRDIAAQQATRDYMKACQTLGKLSHAYCAFLAMAKPSVSEQLRELATLGIKHVIVAPHLLFHGDLMEKCGQMVATMTRDSPQTLWTLASRLGPDEAVVFAAADRIQAALARYLPKK